MVQFHAKLVTTHISSHNTRAQKVKTQEFGDTDLVENGKSMLRSLLLLAACLLLL